MPRIPQKRKCWPVSRWGYAAALPWKAKLPKDLAITKPRHLGVFKGLATLWLILLFNLCLLCSNDNFFSFSLNNFQVSKFLLLQRKDGKQCTAVTNTKLGWTRDCMMQKDLPHWLDDPNFTSSSPKPVINYLDWHKLMWKHCLTKRMTPNIPVSGSGRTNPSAVLLITIVLTQSKISSTLSLFC